MLAAKHRDDKEKEKKEKDVKEEVKIKEELKEEPEVKENHAINEGLLRPNSGIKLQIKEVIIHTLACVIFAEIRYSKNGTCFRRNR